MDISPKSVMFVRFPFMRMDAPEVTDWMVETVVKCKLDPRVSNIPHLWINDTPITMGRNKAVEAAKAAKADFLVMIDNDMKPDAYLSTNPNNLEVDPNAKPFWDSTWDFMLKHYEHGPCMVGAPYCGPPPYENVYVFRWANYQTGHPNADIHIEQYTREESVIRTGFEEVACLPTGLVVIDMRVFDNPLVTPPYFTYEWTDKYEMKKASTEDCVFTRDLNIANIPLYVNWDAWAGHWKMKCVGRPKPLYREQIHKKFIQAVEGVSREKRLRQVRGWEILDNDAGVQSAGGSGSAAASSQAVVPGLVPGSGSEGSDSWSGQDGVRAVGDEPLGCTITTEGSRRSAAIGILRGGTLALTHRGS